MAEDDDDASKTEDPTARRITKAREKGNVLTSQEVKSWAVLVSGSAALLLFGTYMAQRLTGAMVKFLESGYAIDTDPQNLQAVAIQLVLEMGMVLLPIFLAVIVGAVLANIAVSGLPYSPEKIVPKLTKLNPISGAKKLLSVKSVVELLKGIVKLILVGGVAVAVAVPMLQDIALMPDYSVESIMDRVFSVLIAVMGFILAIMTILAAADYWYERHVYFKKLRMTKQETKEEHKETEGDPLVKQKIRSIRRERQRQRMMAAVPTADVIVTNPTHFAVALTYKPEEMTAPRLVAKGIEHLALRIRELAEEHDVPVVENPPLARALYAAVEIDDEIPYEHYQAVAEVIGFVMRLKGRGKG